jgi:hypothetical protein
MSAAHDQRFGRSVTNPVRGIDLLAHVITFLRDGGAFTASSDALCPATTFGKCFNVSEIRVGGRDETHR